MKNNTSNEKINGIGFIAGEEININEEQDYLFLFGLNVDVDSNINNDVFIFGENVEFFLQKGLTTARK